MQGMQCYTKSEFWAGCMASCDRAWGWNCKSIGERTPQRTLGSWPGEDCSGTRLCNMPAQQCVRMDERSAMCVDSIPAGWDGVVLGSAQGEHVVPPAAEDAQVAGTALFCFMAVLPGSAEMQLRDVAERSRASIYACDKHKVYDSYPSTFVHENSWNSFANTEGFVKVWQHVFDDGLFKLTDWTVKVDPDTVFLPSRLKIHLQDMRPPSAAPIYVKNCEIDFGFLGAIEIISRRAMEDFEASHRDCQRSMPGLSGEDGWIKGCLDAVGVGSMLDASILRSPNDESCSEGARVAFHPHKTPEDWSACYESSMR